MFIQGERIDSEVIQVVSNQTNTDIDLVEMINNFQFKIVLEGTRKFRDIEITGLGRIEVKPRILENQIEREEGILETLNKQQLATPEEKTERKIKSIGEHIDYLKTKKEKK